MVFEDRLKIAQAYTLPLIKWVCDVAVCEEVRHEVRGCVQRLLEDCKHAVFGPNALQNLMEFVQQNLQGSSGIFMSMIAHSSFPTSIVLPLGVCVESRRLPLAIQHPCAGFRWTL